MVAIVAASVVFSSCDKDSGTNVDSEINIKMVESLDIFPRTLLLHCSTTKIYPCLDYSIYVTCQQSSKNIDISFKGVSEPPGICRTQPWPATTVIDLGTLSNGTYLINIDNGDVKVKGNLIVSSDSYTVNVVNKSSLSFINTPLNKIPEHTIWGIIGYHEQGTSSLVQSFLTACKNLGATKGTYTPGYYNDRAGHAFEIDKNGDINYPDAALGYRFVQLFIFHYSENITDIEQLVRKYARDYGEHISITVNTDKGEEFLSFWYQ